jgi:hemolysin III
MTQPTYPSVAPIHRRADLIVHLVGLALILGAGGALVVKTATSLTTGVSIAVTVYVLCALASNLASCAYHFAPWHDARKLMRRIDHAAIYPSIAGTFTPFFVQAGTTWTITLLCVSWGLALIAMYKQITDPQVQGKWSTASYLGLGAVGLCALPDLTGVPLATLWSILAGAFAYVIGVGFYVRRAMRFRYAIWHAWVNIGGIAMFVGIWMALFPSAG